MLDRFVRYAKIDTQADLDSTTYPSTAKQRELGELLARELRELGLEDSAVDEHGYVFATLPGARGPTIGLIAHLDTSPDESGANVKPQVVHYNGGDIHLPGDPRRPWHDHGSHGCYRMSTSPDLMYMAMSAGSWAIPRAMLPR